MNRELFEGNLPLFLMGPDAFSSGSQNTFEALVSPGEIPIAFGQNIKRNLTIDVAQFNLEAGPRRGAVTQLAPLFIATKHLAVFTAPDFQSAPVVRIEPVARG